jgi:hypothetical protein
MVNLHTCTEYVSCTNSSLRRLIGLYAATAGTVYVGAKLLATNVRLQDDPTAQRRHQQRHLY